MANAAIDFAPAIAGFTNAFVREREARDLRAARTGQVLFEAAKTDPTLFDDPTAAKVMEKYVGDKDAFALVKNVMQNQPTAEQIAYQQAQGLGVVSPEEQANVGALATEATRAKAINAAGAPSENPMAAIARGAMGAVPFVGGRAANALLGPAPEAPSLPVPNPYAGAQAMLGQRAPQLPGTSTTMTAKGGTAVTRTAPTRKEADESLVNNAAATRVAEIRAENPGMGQSNAMIQAAREVFQAATAEGRAVPKWVTSLATGDSENAIKLALEQGKKVLDVQYAGSIAGATEAGKRGAQMAVPMSPQEAAAGAVHGARTPEGQPLSPAEKAGALQGFSEQFKRGGAYASSSGTAQAALEKDARKAANELFSLNDTMASFAPLAASVLTSAPLKAKTGLQKLRLYVQSGEGSPGIAGLTNLKGLVPRITKQVGGDVGNLAIQEQAAYRSIVDGTWQTQQEFVTNFLTLSMGMDRMAAAKAEILGLPAPPSGKLRKALEPYRKRFPEIDGAIARFDEATAEVPDADLKGKIAASLGLAPPAGTQPEVPTVDLGDGFKLEPVQ